MKLINPSTEVLWGLEDGKKVLRRIELVARTCYKSEKHTKPRSARQLTRKMLKRGHFTPFEFHHVCVRFICDRGISHELVRHRICSFLQESTRYCDYEGKGLTFIIPSWVAFNRAGKEMDPLAVSNMSRHANKKFFETDEASAVWINEMAETEIAYICLRQLDWKPQQARDVLPNSLKTEVCMLANLREWRHVFKLRCNKAAHPDMVKLMRPLLKQFAASIPIIFDDLMEEFFPEVCEEENCTNAS